MEPAPLQPAPETIPPQAPAHVLPAQPLAPPPVPPPPPPSEPAHHKEPSGPCLLGEWCIGPIFTLGAINPLGIGLQVRGDYFGAALDYQFMPTLSISDTDARWSLFSIDARVFPFAGSFFASLGFGHQSFRAGRIERTQYGPVEATGALSIPMFKLGLGFISRSGLSMGIDLGVGFPIGDTDLDLNLRSHAAAAFADEPEYQAAEADVRKSIDDAADAAVKLIPFIPQINFFRIGYQF